MKWEQVELVVVIGGHLAGMLGVFRGEKLGLSDFSSGFTRWAKGETKGFLSAQIAGFFNFRAVLRR